MCGRMTFAGTERFFNINPFIPRTLEISPSLLPADYCQRERVSDVQRIGTEFVWKSPIRFSDKVLCLKVPMVDNIHYCQLGKMAVVTRYSRFHGNEGHRTCFIGSVDAGDRTLLS